HPELLWAQRANEIYLTINVSDLAEGYTLTVEPTSIDFKAKDASGKEYAFHLDLYAELNADNTKTQRSARNIFLILDKKTHDEGWWPRLLKDKVKLPFLKTDFARWKDEDESEEEEDPTGGMDPMMMGGGAGGM
ncbi:HSP20-like chaperone, partial [Piptocephalis cylindrospora]